MQNPIKINPFNIPAIHNEKEALLIHLGLDTENTEVWDSVVEVGTYKIGCHLSHPVSSYKFNVFTFEYSGNLYQVSSSNSSMLSKVVVTFNGSLYGVKELGDSQAVSPLLGQAFAEYSADYEDRKGELPTMYSLRISDPQYVDVESPLNDLKNALAEMEEEKESAIKLVLRLWDGQVIAEWEATE